MQSAVKSSSHELMVAGFAALVGGVAGQYLTGSGNVSLFGASMPVWAGIGAAVGAGHIGGKLLAEQVAPRLGQVNPAIRSNLPVLMSGLATYGVVRAGMSSSAKLLPVMALGSGSSMAGERLHSAVMGGR